MGSRDNLSSQITRGYKDFWDLCRKIAASFSSSLPDGFVREGGRSLSKRFAVANLIGARGLMP